MAVTKRALPKIESRTAGSATRRSMNTKTASATMATTPATSATPSAPGTASWRAPNVAATMNVAAAARPGKSIEMRGRCVPGAAASTDDDECRSGSCTQNTSRQPPRSVEQTTDDRTDDRA